ncbi:MAG TPA: class I SAM-dependent methyltransferase [Verrucomicrobiae bacterium]|nr:class I SAM-dependent methyltransferase [Verrucomicrobiae bacterium]
MRCNLCGADDADLLFPKEIAPFQQIVRCRQCELMYANPRGHVDCDDFAEQGLNKVYDPESPDYRQYYQKQLTQLPDNLRALRVINELFPQRGKLLEIGPFAGIFLDRIRSDGWTVTGLEPDLPMGRYARAKYGLEIVDGVLPNPALPAAAFDVVLLLHVIEHIPDPSSTIRDVRNLVREGGVFVVETPRFNSLLFKILQHRERSIQNCPGHIYFFTEHTLRAMLERNGFKVFKTERVGRTLTLERFIWNVGLVTRSSRLRDFLMRICRTMHLDKVHFHINFRDMQRMYARAV